MLFAYIVFILVAIAVIVFLAKNVHFGTIEEMEKFWGCSLRDVRKIDDSLLRIPKR